MKNKKATCLYCGHTVNNETIVPDVDDTPAWNDLAKEHKRRCEWIITRAHRINLKSEG